MSSGNKLTRGLKLAAVFAVAALVTGSMNAANAAVAKSEYLVMTSASSQASVDAKIAALGGKTVHRFDGAIRGFTASLTANAAAALKSAPGVNIVEPNGTVTIADTQNSPTWGLDRIDEADLPMDGAYTYPTNPGQGVRIYIADTGTQTSLSDFTGRWLTGVNFTGDGTDPNVDCHGHGTHVAGTAAGTVYGVAKAATIMPLKVLQCTGSGSYQGIIDSLNWVVANNPAGTRGVVSMSLGGGFSSALNSAIATATNNGIVVVVAAGNNGLDACNYSPASAASAITVGATDSTDTRASFSNYGNCLDIFAPGVNVTSDQPNGGTATWNGTSMATPHVSGVAALYLQQYPSATPAQVSSALQANGLAGKVNSASSTANYLVNMQFANGPVVAPTNPSVPTGLKVVAGSNGSYVTSWNAVAPITNGVSITYNVRLTRGSVVTYYNGLTTTSQVLSSLSRRTTYSVAVQAVSGSATSAYSSSVTFKTK
ncbi:MAG: S8 family serine peptidase [Micrococcales bacterium]